MKTGKFKSFKISYLFGLILISLISCEREILESAASGVFSNNPDVFIDGFSAGLEYLPFGDSDFGAFSVDTETRFDGAASMRLDVPNAGDPAGAYAGAIFPDYGGRDLSGYDALTFYAKASQSGIINEIGFGQDFGENKYQAVLQNLQLSTNWNKYVIAIPDPSKLTQESGLFWYAEGPENGVGYSFWIDELKFEKLGTIAQPRPAILDGEDVATQTFIGSGTQLTGLTQTFNLGTGLDQTLVAAPGYFTFNSSNPAVATVDESGFVSIVGAGTAVITASLGGVDAAGSLTLNSLGDFTPAPTPQQDPANVISIFSDAYINYPVDFYNGYFAPFQTTQGQDDLEINGDNIIKYTDLNFVATEFKNPTLDATVMTNFHVDIQVEESIDPGDFIRIQLGDFGADAVFGGGDDSSGSVQFPGSTFTTGQWTSLDIPIADFGLSSLMNMAQIFFISDATISTILVDNMYFYREVIEPSPNVDDSAATEVALPLGFESTTLTYDFLGFEGADSAIEANPNPSVTGINTTATVMRSKKTDGAQFFAGTLLNLDSPIDFSSSQKFRMKVYSPKFGIPIRVRLEDQNNTAGIELDAITTTLNEWEEIEWDFAGTYNPGVDYVRMVVFFEFVPGLPGDGSTYYFDDIQIVD